MDWLVQLGTATFPAAISGLIAYFSAKKSSDTELKKVEKNAELELQKAERELKKIQQEQLYKLRELEKTQEGEIEKYQRMMEIDSQKNENDISNKFAEKFMEDLLSGKSNFEDLNKLVKEFEKFNDFGK